MKTKLLLLNILIFHCMLLRGQSDDLQWLIMDNIGKQSEYNSLNIYPPGNTINRLFKITGAKVPDQGNHPDAGNDLFMIFSDGNQYNSRYINVTSEFFIGPFSTNETHNFSNGYSSPITYSYMTNKYEEDDLPRNIVVASDPTIESDVNPIRPSPAPIISASHNVVFGRDITVVVNYDSLRLLYGAGGAMPTFSLGYDGYEFVGVPGVVTYGVDIFDPSNVFEKPTGEIVAGYPFDKVTDTGSERIKLEDGAEPYRFINLRTNQDAVRFAQREENVAQFKAVFTLYMGKEKTHHSLTEDMLSSFDPNYLGVDSICMAPDSGYHIFYHLEFENTSKIGAITYSAVVHFPKHFDLTCFDTIKWYAAGAPCTGDFVIAGDSCTFTFDSPYQLMASDDNPKGGQGYVEFRVKVRPGYDVSDFNNSLRLTDPTVYFDGIPFDLKDFRDKVYAKQNSISRIIGASCAYCETGPGPINWLLVLVIVLAIAAFILLFVNPGWVIKKPTDEEVREPITEE